MDRLAAYLHCELWDLLAEGTDAVLDLARGELGLDGLRISAVAGPVCSLRARPGASPRTFACEAAAHFQPDAHRYGDTRLRPPVAAWIKSRNPLAQLADACAKRNLRLRARVVACDNAALVERQPHVACIDAFGDPSPAWMCPANPDVRAYLRDLLDDLAAYDAIEAIDLAEADFGPPPRFHPGRADPAAPRDARSTLLCFCPSCRRLAGEAGIDAASLAAHIVESFDAGRPPQRERLQPFEAFRERAVADLLAHLHRGLRCELWWDACDAAPHAAAVEHAAGQIVRFDPQLSVPAKSQPPPALASDRIGIAYPVGLDRPLEGGAPAVVREVTELTARGHRVVIFDQYGTTPPERLDWIRQAVRFARRQTAK